MQSHFPFLSAAPASTADPARSRAPAARAGGFDGRPSLRHSDDARDALLVLDIETVPDAALVPVGWPEDRFPKAAWHRIVALSFVTADIRRGAGGTEAYVLSDCRSGGEPGWDERRLLKAFWRSFDAGNYRVVTWNGRAFDMPTILARSMIHGIDAAAWFQRGTRWEGYRHRFAVDWHTDLMDAISEQGATQRLSLEEAATSIGLPGKLGEHGSEVASLIAAGEIDRVRAYCETDCLNLAILYALWAHLTGRTAPDSHDRTVAGIIDFLDAARGGRPHL